MELFFIGELFNDIMTKDLTCEFFSFHEHNRTPTGVPFNFDLFMSRLKCRIFQSIKQTNKKITCEQFVSFMKTVLPNTNFNYKQILCQVTWLLILPYIKFLYVLSLNFLFPVFVIKFFSSLLFREISLFKF